MESIRRYRYGYRENKWIELEYFSSLVYYEEKYEWVSKLDKLSNYIQQVKKRFKKNIIKKD